MEILDSVEVFKYVFGFSKAGLGFAIAFVVTAALAIVASEYISSDGIGALAFASTICLGVSIVLFMLAKPEYDYTKYYATIEDSTPISEVLDKYEVIDIHGKIYELKEREDVNGND